MTWSRREVLATLGVTSAQALLSACGAPVVKQTKRGRGEASPEIRVWLRDAVATLRGAGFENVHVLAVSRRRTTAAMDVLGAGVARAWSDGVVLTVRDRAGVIREQVTNELTRDGVAAAVRVLAGKAKPVSVDFGYMPPIPKPANPDPDQLSDGVLLARVGALAARDKALSSRVVYSAAMLDIDDAHVWSIAPGRDLEQRLVRVRKSITRVAWNGTRPIVAEAMRAWSGSVDAPDLDLTDEEIIGAKEAALALMTPSAFSDGEHDFVMSPEVAASVIDAAVRGLLTSAALRRPEVGRRLAIGANAVARSLTLVDDPTAPDAYGGFRFDDEGEPAAPVTLVDKGRVIGRLADRGAVLAKLANTPGRGQRPGHVGAVEPGPSHIRLAKGTDDANSMLDNGFILEGAQGAIVDPSSDRVVIAVARAYERTAGRLTGRVFADIELVGELAKVLASISGLSSQTRSIGIRDEVDGQPRWRSIETPSLRGRGVMRARRRPA